MDERTWWHIRWGNMTVKVADFVEFNPYEFIRTTIK